MSKRIMALYEKKGITRAEGKPIGKGIHTFKFHKCVTEIAEKQGGIIDKSKQGGVNAWAVCMKSLGREKAVKKAHLR